MRRLGMFLADVVLGALVAGVVMPVLIARGFVQTQAHFWTITIGCIALVCLLHGTFARRSR